MSSSKDTHQIDLTAYPSPGKGRELYFVRLTEANRRELARRGYKVVYLSQLPRSTVDEERQYLLKKAQGMEVGTVPIDDDQIGALRLLFKHTGLLDEARGNPPEKAQEVKIDIDALLQVAREKESRFQSPDRSVKTQLDLLEEEE